MLVRIISVLLVLTLTWGLWNAWRLRAPRGAFLQRLLGLLVAAWLLESFGLVSSELGIRNVAFYNLFVAVDFAVLLSLVQVVRPRWKPVLRVLLVVGLAALLLVLRVRDPFAGLLFEGVLTVHVLSAALIAWLLTRMAFTASVPLAREPAFWVFVGALFYYGGTIPVLGAWKVMTHLDPAISRLMYMAVVSLAIVRYGFAALAFRLERRRRGAQGA
jgi:hypothetical protein